MAHYRRSNQWTDVMALDEKLIEILRCPKCKGTLEKEPEDRGFICRACGLRYPVDNGIPNFLISEAEPIPKLSR